MSKQEDRMKMSSKTNKLPETKKDSMQELFQSSTLLKRSTKTSGTYEKQNSTIGYLDSKKEVGEYDQFKPQLKNFYLDESIIKQNCRLFPSEKLERAERVSYDQYLVTMMGVIAITDYRMVFCFEDDKKLGKLNFHPDYFHVPFFQIEKVIKIQDKEKTASCPLEITLKDSRVLKFYLWEEKSNIIELLNTKCFPKDPEMLFGFTSTYNDSHINMAQEQGKENSFMNGWNIFNAEKEFQRQGIFEPNNDKLRYSKINQDFKAFPTYPELLVVHSEVNDKQLIEASKHRTKNRLPALSFFYKKNKGNTTIKSFIWRSSQTKSGIMGSKNDADVILLNKITQLCQKLVIFDARPYLNAVANKANGGGFENVEHYDNTQLVFCDIDNIHAVRNSLAKVQQLCLSPKM